MTTENKWTVEQCCCFCTLRTGSLIIAVFALVMTVINLVSSVYAASSGHGYASWVSFILDVCHLIACIMLVFGIQKEKSNYVMLWVWTTIVMIVLTLITAVISFIELSWQNAIIMVLTVIIYGYCVVVVRSYAISMQMKSVVSNPA
ncbi:unnamed protein product [Meganyctiphanes norvegica]|uniref:Uncharacterized protein n=1 Tax=Meganyctiphanes norvegica TaxID=48144 RepID=A0AAV2PWV4_MEGNR